MKTAALLCLLVISVFAFSQSISGPSMTFYGIDFTKARMIGEGFYNPNDIKDRLFDSWNGLFRTEPDKYDLYKAFKKEKVTFDFTNVERVNKTVNPQKMVSNSEYSISPSEAASVLDKYTPSDISGLGCVFVVESFDKTKALGFIYVIFFNTATKKVILCEKMECKAGGFGLKNYWARTIFEVIDASPKQFKKWLKKSN
jgi:hypothetical protein